MACLFALDDHLHQLTCLMTVSYPRVLTFWMLMNYVIKGYHKNDESLLMYNLIPRPDGWSWLDTVGIHYNDVIMGAIASQITSLTIVYSTVYSDADQRKHQGSASLAFCAGNSPATGEFPAQMASNAEKVSIWWRHHVIGSYTTPLEVYIIGGSSPSIIHENDL